VAIEPEVLVLNEPTRGVDIGAKEEICNVLRSLAEAGCALVLASSDLDEVLALADRILVMVSGRIAAEFPRAETTKHALIEAMGSSRTFARQ
jgi:ABC-type sugar transport system ATPase subunit